MGNAKNEPCKAGPGRDVNMMTERWAGKVCSRKREYSHLAENMAIVKDWGWLRIGKTG